jgi:hypothetical protein
MIKEETGLDKRLYEKQLEVDKQTKQMNLFYNPEEADANLISYESGGVKPLDKLAEKDLPEISNSHISLFRSCKR